MDRLKETLESRMFEKEGKIEQREREREDIQKGKERDAQADRHNF